MRLWHKDLIPVLPRQQLLAQWRECCCIAKNIAEHDTPNHILVNKVMNYPIQHFITYTYLVAEEMKNRGYKVDKRKFDQYFKLRFILIEDGLFRNWHNERYLRQCYYNLQEKYDCGGITDQEWWIIHKAYMGHIK